MTEQERTPEEEWLDTPDSDLTPALARSLLESIPDDLWAVAACADRLLDDIPTQHVILDVGIKRSERLLGRVKEDMLVAVPAAFDEQGQGIRPGLDQDEAQRENVLASLSSYFATNERARDVCSLRAELLSRRHLLGTFGTIFRLEGYAEPRAAEEGDDPWAETDLISDPSQSTSSPTSSSQPHFSAFFFVPCLQHALSFAMSANFAALEKICARHRDEIYPHRFDVLDSIPAHAHPVDFGALLLRVNESTNAEERTWPHDVDDIQEEREWTLDNVVRQALALSEGDDPASLPTPATTAASLGLNPPIVVSASVPVVSDWYIARIRRLDALGLTDTALALVQHGASHDVPGLDALGEELSLLSRMVYDAAGASALMSGDEDTEAAALARYTLSQWRAMQPDEVVRAYLRSSQPATIAGDLRRLVLPYLYVLEAHYEREGRPDTSLVSRYLRSFILDASNSYANGLRLVASVFEASKPTSSVSQRLVKDDADLARLALSVLYGSESTDGWETMSRIFECLPAFDGVTTDPATASRLAAEMAALLTPTSLRPSASPAELFEKVLSAASLPALSALLDALDMHLESGEILSRWHVPAPLRVFLQSAQDVQRQRSWATRMARRGVGRGDGDGVVGFGGPRMESEDEWISLLADMLRLRGGEDGVGQGALPGPFGLLEEVEVKKIFFGGLLTAGKLDLARSLLLPSSGSMPLSAEDTEELVIAASRELYDNAASGNLHRGDMKLAYECLTVAPPTPSLRREREFIEATSRLCSFRLYSRPGIPISPIEIRLSKDKLSLIARLLSSNEDAYRHPDVILDLVNRLGFRGDKDAEGKTLAMLADAAMQVGDHAKAAETCERLVKVAFALRKRPSSTRPMMEAGRTKDRHDRASSSASVSSRERDRLPAATSTTDAKEVAWRTCYQLSKQPDFEDLDAKLMLMGSVLSLCPTEQLADLLGYWREVNAERERRDGGGQEEGDGGRRRTGGKKEIRDLFGEGPASERSQMSSFSSSPWLKPGQLPSLRDTSTGAFAHLSRAAQLFDYAGNTTTDTAFRAARSLNRATAGFTLLGAPAAEGAGGGDGSGRGYEGGREMGAGGDRSASPLPGGLGGAFTSWLIGDGKDR